LILVFRKSLLFGFKFFLVLIKNSFGFGLDLEDLGLKKFGLRHCITGHKLKLFEGNN